MFRQIRWRLALSTAVAVSIFLVLGSGVTYWFVQTRLYRQFDQVTVIDLRAAYRNLSRSHAKVFAHLPVILPPYGPLFREHQPLAIAFWTSSGHLIQAPAFLDRASKRILASHLAQAPQTVMLQGHWYRVEMRRMPAAWMLRNPVMDTWRMQVIKNCDDIVFTLRALITILLVMLGVSAGASVLLGLWVAGRALVPIRLAWERQRRFVADASHEMRTPLMAAQARTELLLDRPNATVEEVSPKLLGLFAELRRLSRLVEDLLALSRADSGEQQSDRRDVSIDRIVRDVAEQVEPLCAMRNISLEVHGDAPFVRRVDESRFRQLLLILLDNAIQYNVEGGRIDVTHEPLDKRWRLRVKDTGVGIAPEALPHVFDRFYRGDPTRARTDGFGLGLAIAEWIAHLHGAAIHVHSARGAGTEFTVIFPNA